MKRLFLMMSMGLSAALLAAHQANAAQCADRDTVIAHLSQQYGETRQSVALGHDNTMVEVFASLQTGTWSLVVTRAGGPTCLVAAGSAYHRIDPVDTPPDPAT